MVGMVLPGSRASAADAADAGGAPARGAAAARQKPMPLPPSTTGSFSVRIRPITPKPKKAQKT